LIAEAAAQARAYRAVPLCLVAPEALVVAPLERRMDREPPVGAELAAPVDPERLALELVAEAQLVGDLVGAGPPAARPLDQRVEHARIARLGGVHQAAAEERRVDVRVLVEHLVAVFRAGAGLDVDRHGVAARALRTRRGGGEQEQREESPAA